MGSNAFTRAVVESVVGHAIRRIAADPERGLRSLVDMGVTAATGRFQKHYMNIIQGVLEDPECPYYEMVCRTARQTENRNLTTFGVNVGWESWTVGARHIRGIEAREGFDVPWSLTFHMDGSGGEGNHWSALVRAGQEMGIYTYFLHVNGDRSALVQALELARQAGRCAFVLFLSPELAAPALGELAALDNTAVMVRTAGPDWREAVGALREERRLYGLWRLCETAEDVEGTAAWLEDIQDEGGIAAFSIASPDCPAASRAQPRRLTEETWRGQHYPLLVFDYYDDILLVDETISDGPCFIGVQPDGEAAVYQDGRETPLGVNLREQPLLRALQLRSSLVQSA